MQRRLTHYRVEMFQQLRRILDARGVDFLLAHGGPAPSERSKNDSGHLDWAIDAPCRYAMGDRVVWQSPGVAGSANDLVIVPQENRLLYNLLLLTLRRPRRLAFWGHGRNFQTDSPDSLGERFKRATICSVDWWFAYTRVSADWVAAAGFPNERITTLENSIDTRKLAEDCHAVMPAEIAALRNAHGIGDGPIGMFLGSLYDDKRIPFLLDAARRVRARVEGFHLLIAGDGPAAQLVRRASEAEPWIHMLGVQTGADKARCLRAADLLMNPGLVGLGILDGFVAGVPMVTTDCRLHSPEIAYLRNGENGIMTSDSMADYVDVCVRLLGDPVWRMRMATTALADGRRYTIENMAGHFATGIVGALSQPPH